MKNMAQYTMMECALVTILVFTSIYIHLENIYQTGTMERHCPWVRITELIRLSFGYYVYLEKKIEKQL